MPKVTQSIPLRADLGIKRDLRKLAWVRILIQGAYLVIIGEKLAASNRMAVDDVKL